MPALVILAIVLFLSLLFNPGSGTTSRMSRQDRKQHEKIIEGLDRLWQDPSDTNSFRQIRSNLDKLHAPDTLFQKLYDKSLDLVEHHRHHEEGRTVAKRITRKVGRRMEKSEPQITGDISDRL